MNNKKTRKMSKNKHGPPKHEPFISQNSTDKIDSVQNQIDEIKGLGVEDDQKEKLKLVKDEEDNNFMPGGSSNSLSNEGDVGGRKRKGGGSIYIPDSQTLSEQIRRASGKKFAEMFRYFDKISESYAFDNVRPEFSERIEWERQFLVTMQNALSWPQNKMGLSFKYGGIPIAATSAMARPLAKRKRLKRKVMTFVGCCNTKNYSKKADFLDNLSLERFELNVLLASGRIDYSKKISKADLKGELLKFKNAKAEARRANIYSSAFLPEDQANYMLENERLKIKRENERKKVEKNYIEGTVAFLVNEESKTGLIAEKKNAETKSNKEETESLVLQMAKSLTGHFDEK